MNNQFVSLEKLSDIPDNKYFGYIWMSDHSEPVFYYDEKIDNKIDLSKIEENPFIIEGYLYSEDKKLSISIKHYDEIGYKIDQIQLELEPEKLVKENEHYTEHIYLADPALVRAADKEIEIDSVIFIQHWEEQPDELCAEMNVLLPSWIAFIGFGNKEVEK